MGSGEVLLPELLEHVREHEQELQGDRVLWQGRRLSGLAHQEDVIDAFRCAFAWSCAMWQRRIKDFV